MYVIGAALLGLLTAIVTYFLTRRREPAHEGGYRETTGTRESGPVIGDLDQSSAERRGGSASPKPEVAAPAAEAPALAPKPQPAASSVPPVRPEPPVAPPAPPTSGHSGSPFGSPEGTDKGDLD
jgi:hypothetical protein